MLHAHRYLRQAAGELVEHTHIRHHAVDVEALQAGGDLVEGAGYLVAGLGEGGAVVAQRARAFGQGVRAGGELAHCAGELIEAVGDGVKLFRVAHHAADAVGHAGNGESGHGEVVHFGREAHVALAAGQDDEGYLLIAACVGHSAVAGADIFAER